MYGRVCGDYNSISSAIYSVLGPASEPGRDGDGTSIGPEIQFHRCQLKLRPQSVRKKYGKELRFTGWRLDLLKLPS